MVSVKITDNRYYSGFRIKYFSKDEVTPEIVSFVKSNTKAYGITVNGHWLTREQFLQQYNVS